jgi:hypothetical protein
MKFKQILLERIPREELRKLNAMSFLLSPPKESSRNIVYERGGSNSDFYNTGDLTSGIRFYKKVSLLPDQK